MGNDVTTNFFYEERKKVANAEFSSTFLRRILSAVAGDIYTKSQITEACRKILKATMPTGKQGGGIEIKVDNIYWFTLTAFKSGGVYVGLSVEDTYAFNDVAMSDFTRRVKAAYEILRPEYACTDLIDGMIGAMQVLKDRFRSHLCWLTFYSPQLIKKIGKEKFVAAVNEVNRKLGGGVSLDLLIDGGVMIKAGSVPGESYTHERIVGLERELFGKECVYHKKRTE